MARRIAVEIVGDSSSLERALKRSAKSAKTFNGQIDRTGRSGRGRSLFGGLAKGASLLTGALGVGGLTTAVRASFGEMADAQKVAAQTAAVLKSTHGAANVTAKGVDDLATSLMNMSGVDDEAIKSGENMLLTFRGIRNEAGKGNDIFDQATRAVLDFSVATGKDMKGAAIQVGKALQDPIKGVTALGRAGVQFTDAQKKQIKALVDSGKTMQAQKIILKELNTEFGGSAKAAGETLPGQLNKLKNVALNLGGAIAQTLTPEIKRIAASITDWLSKTKNQKAVMDAARSAMNTLKVAATTLVAGLKFLRGAFRVLSKVVGGNANAIKVLIGAYAAFKVLRFAGRIATLAGSLRQLRGATGRATVATGNLGGATNRAAGKAGKLRGAAGRLKGALGKAGLVAAVGLLSYELTTAFLHATHLDQKFRDLGASAYDLAAKIGLVNDQMAQFEGKPQPKAPELRSIRRQSVQLQRRGGLTPRQAGDLLARQHRGVSRTEVLGAAGARGKPIVNVQNVHVRAQDPRQLVEGLSRLSRRRPRRRRGT